MCQEWKGLFFSMTLKTTLLDTNYTNLANWANLFSRKVLFTEFAQAFQKTSFFIVGYLSVQASSQNKQICCTRAEISCVDHSLGPADWVWVREEAFSWRTLHRYALVSRLSRCVTIWNNRTFGGHVASRKRPKSLRCQGARWGAIISSCRSKVKETF